ncbi:hypothetical protein EV178_004852 [Coemansia sp. RSA 1646]|nr:hypothetical protein EV178_004852 [Coemansia sp. RSA 1646]KAJ2088823.1 hypothetical protein IW138_003895 [Coemansia sp. RSA 986]
MSSSTIDTDREAKRKARYRGNPERARFHRHHNVDEFEIKVRDDLDKSKHSLAARETSGRSPAELVRGLRRVSINELAEICKTTRDKQSVACSNEQTVVRADKEDGRPAVGIKALMVGVPLKEQKHNSANKEAQSSGGVDPRTAAAADETDNDTTELVGPSFDDDAGIVLEQASTSGSDSERYGELRREEPSVNNAAKHATEMASSKLNSKDHHSTDEAPSEAETPETVEKLEKSKASEKLQRQQRRQQRHRREDADSKDLETVLQEVPKRMTRSMAKKIGVQTPRRYFGEGVSTSQILRPVKSTAAARRKPGHEEEASSLGSAADEQETTA